MTQQILKLKELKLLTRLSSGSIYRKARQGTFPSPIKLSERSSGWLASEVDQWLEERIAASRNGEA